MNFLLIDYSWQNRSWQSGAAGVSESLFHKLSLFPQTVVELYQNIHTYAESTSIGFSLTTPPPPPPPNQTKFLLPNEEISCLTPSLPQPVKFPSWKLHTRAWKRYIFQSFNKSISQSFNNSISRSFNKSTFNTVHFDENPFTTQANAKKKKKTKMA